MVATQTSQTTASATIVSRRDLTAELFIIRLQPSVPFTFKPGQYCTIGLNGIERPYSMVSAPHEDSLELFIEVVPPPDGVLTPLLHECQVGAQLSLRPRAKGLFTFNAKYPDHLMVATATGIAPFLSIVRDYLHRGLSGHRFVIIHGSSYRDELGYQDELSQLASEHPNITYIPTISRPREERNKGWAGELGRVTALLDCYIERHALHAESTLVSVCGHPLMIEDVKALLGPRGFKVAEERYWKE